MKKIYGLIGYPVKHSLSPAMHMAAFKYYNIDAEYNLFEIRPDELNSFIKNLSQNNIYGLNVTVPHKVKVLDYVSLDEKSFFLRDIGAVNTIVREGDRINGFNTDVPGFERHLKENLNPSDKRCAIMGAGGAARAVSYVLAKCGAKEIVIFDIDKMKSESVIRIVKGLFPDFQISQAESVEQLDIRNKDLLINATPVGLKDSDPCLVEADMLHKDIFVYDLIYNPQETKLLVQAKKIGARTANGLGMLLYQGMLSFNLWTKKDAPVEIMKKALQEGLSQCQKK